MVSFLLSIEAKNFCVNWVNEFKRGRTSTEDKHRLARTVEVTTPEVIDKIHDMVLSDRRIKERKIVEITSI